MRRTVAIAGIAVALVSLVVGAVYGGDGTASWLAYLATFAVYAVVGGFVALRRPEHPVGWLFLAIGLSAEVGGVAEALARTIPSDRTAAGIALVVLRNLWVVAFCLIGPLLVVFPTGRLPSRSWRLVPVATVVAIAVGMATSGSVADGANPVLLFSDVLGEERALALVDAGQTASMLTMMALLVAGAVALPLRLRRASGTQRQQLLWFAYAGGVLVVTFVALTLIHFSPAKQLIDPHADIPVTMLGGVPFLLSATAVPLAAAVAILRYRLYDIDVLINRTIVYGAVTTLLAATYFGAVVLIQAALRPFTSGSELAVAASTLLVVALFGPLRARTQRAVDRRFYRARYDAARTLDAFGNRLRDQVDLDSVRADLLGVVGDTLRPAHASVWLRTAAAARVDPVTLLGRPAPRKDTR